MTIVLILGAQPLDLFGFQKLATAMSQFSVCSAVKIWNAFALQKGAKYVGNFSAECERLRFQSLAKNIFQIWCSKLQTAGRCDLSDLINPIGEPSRNNQIGLIRSE